MFLYYILNINQNIIQNITHLIILSLCVTADHLPLTGGFIQTRTVQYVVVAVVTVSPIEIKLGAFGASGANFQQLPADLGTFLHAPGRYVMPSG